MGCLGIRSTPSTGGYTHNTNLLQRAELHLELLLERQQSGVLEVDEPVHILKVCPQSRLKLVFRLPAVDR